jgi:sugar lactone lactonase YvrE
MRQQGWNLGLIALAVASCNFPSLPPLAGGGGPGGDKPDGGMSGGDPDGGMSGGDPDGDTIGGDGPDGDPTSDDGPDPVEPGLFSLELLAGDIRGAGYTDGTGPAARFGYPYGVAADSGGTVYVADTYNHTIRKITPDGTVTTLAGRVGRSGSADGTGVAARFRSPRGVAVDSAGNVYVADTDNHTIRKVSPDGVVITLAGSAGRHGSVNGTGGRARFYEPGGVAVDSVGNVYVADTSNLTIRKITADGVTTTLAGIAGIFGSADGTGAGARFYAPAGLAVDSAGDVYVADSGNYTIRKVTAAGVVTTLVGTAGEWGSADGTGAAARFGYPTSAAVDSAGNLYIVDGGRIRKVTPARNVTTLAGCAGEGSRDGVGTDACFRWPHAAAVDGAANVYVADRGNSTIRKVTAAGVVTTLAGAASVEALADGTGAEARFRIPSDVAVDSAGNIYLADAGNSAIRRITAAGDVTTLSAISTHANGITVDSSGSIYVSGNYTIGRVLADGVATLAGAARESGSTDGGPSDARFVFPTDMATDSAGNIYVADHRLIRRVTADGFVTTMAGDASTPGSDDGERTAARFYTADSVAVDSAGTVYVADRENHNIRKVTAEGVVTTLAGTARLSGSADGRGTAARFRLPSGMAVDSAGNVYVADSGNAIIRKVAPDGTVTTVAGRAGYSQITLGSTPGLAWPRSLAMLGDSIVVVDLNAVLLLRPRPAATAR